MLVEVDDVAERRPVVAVADGRPHNRCVRRRAVIGTLAIGQIHNRLDVGRDGGQGRRKPGAAAARKPTVAAQPVPAVKLPGAPDAGVARDAVDALGGDVVDNRVKL